MASKTTKTPTGANRGVLGNVSDWQASDTRIDTTFLRELQATFIARRTRLAPEHVRLVAELAFDRRAA